MQRPSFNPFAASLFLLQALLPWLASCSEGASATEILKRVQLTEKSLNNFTVHLVGDSACPRSIKLLAGIAADKFSESLCTQDIVTAGLNESLWMKYVIGSAAVLGRVDECALSVIHELWSNKGAFYFSSLLEELNRKNDLDTIAHVIAKYASMFFWNSSFGSILAKLIRENWDTMRLLFEKVFAILRESKDKAEEHCVMTRYLSTELQYEVINSGKIALDEIGKVYPLKGAFYPPLREVFFRARWSPAPNPQIREYIARMAPWFKQFMPAIPSNARDTCVVGSVEPGHDVWNHIRSFVDAETLIFVWPLVCSTWSKSRSKILAEHTRVNELLLQDLYHVSWRRIHTIAPWSHFLNEANSAVYLGQCILSGALGMNEPDRRLDWVIGEYLRDVANGKVPIPRARKKGATHESFAKLIEKGYEIYHYGMPTLCKPRFLTDEEHESVIHYLVCQKKLVVKLSCRWIVENVSRIYSVLGADQVLIGKVIDLSAHSPREVFFIWIMVGRACGITEDTARQVFDKPGIFTERFIRPIVVKPREYYDFIARSGTLFDMVEIYYKGTAYGTLRRENCPAQELSYLIISLILSFKDRPAKIEEIVASMSSRLPTLDGQISELVKDRFGTGTLMILAGTGKYPPENVAFVKGVLAQCGLLDESVI